MAEFGDPRLPEFFWARVRIIDSDCWEWIGAKCGLGYGGYNHDQHNDYAHRVAYMTLCEPIPRGLDIDHLCRFRKCVNPSHLEVVTRQENLRRGNGATHARGADYCRNGEHELTPDNTYTSPSGIPTCKKCKRAGARRYRETHRSLLAAKERTRQARIKALRGATP